MFGQSPFGRRFGSVFQQLEREMADMERRMNEVLRRARENADGPTNGNEPFVYGWTMNVGPEGEPEIRRFGNVQEFAEDSEEWREPFVTSLLDEDKNAVRFTAELPGVDKDKIDVQAFENGLKLEAVGEDRRYRTEIPVDVELDPETSEARYNNGILEVSVGLSTESEVQGHSVDVR